MKTPRKHAALIKAWADGADIQESFKGDETWLPFDGFWMENDFEYRIKPEPKPDVVRLLMAELHHNLKLTFDGETSKLKAAEVIV